MQRRAAEQNQRSLRKWKERAFRITFRGRGAPASAPRGASARWPRPPARLPPRWAGREPPGCESRVGSWGRRPRRCRPPSGGSPWRRSRSCWTSWRPPRWEAEGGGGRRVRSGCHTRTCLRRCERGLTLDHPGSPEVQPAHRTQPQRLCPPAAAPWWEQ